jgi:hypothetical protein
LCLADAAVDNKNQLILPVLSKFLVCSAFFASNNPARTDNKFFGRGKSRGHTRTVAGKVGQGKAGREVCHVIPTGQAMGDVGASQFMQYPKPPCLSSASSGQGQAIAINALLGIAECAVRDV